MSQEFSEKSALQALAAASTILIEAKITAIWLDMSGSGWSGSYRITIQAETDIRSKVTIRDMVKKDYWVMTNETTRVIKEALADLDLGQYLRLEFSCMRNLGDPSSAGKQIWPVRDLRMTLESKIKKLQDKLAELKGLQGPEDEHERN